MKKKTEDELQWDVINYLKEQVVKQNDKIRQLEKKIEDVKETHIHYHYENQNNDFKKFGPYFDSTPTMKNSKTQITMLEKDIDTIKNGQLPPLMYRYKDESCRNSGTISYTHSILGDKFPESEINPEYKEFYKDCSDYVEPE